MRAVLVSVAILLCSAGSSSALTLKGFQTPSGKIRCAGFKDGGRYALRCDLYAHSWAAPSLPPCTDAGDRGSSVSVTSRGRVQWPCVSDAVDTGPVLAYGRRWRFGPFRCMSRRTGLTCKNRAAHGWFVSRARYRIY